MKSIGDSHGRLIGISYPVSVVDTGLDSQLWNPMGIDSATDAYLIEPTIDLQLCPNQCHYGNGRVYRDKRAVFSPSSAAAVVSHVP